MVNSTEAVQVNDTVSLTISLDVLISLPNASSVKSGNYALNIKIKGSLEKSRPQEKMTSDLLCFRKSPVF